MIDPISNKPWTVLSCGINAANSPVLRIMSPDGHKVVVVKLNHADFAKVASFIPCRSATTQIPGVTYR